MTTGRTRRLTRAKGFALAWSPDGKSIAYIAGNVDRLGRIDSRDLRLITLAGRVSSVVDSEHSYGGRIASLAWVRPPASTRYRKPQPAPATRVSPEGLLVDGPIERIAADGDRVVISACGEIFVWAPGQARPPPPEHVASLHYFCNTQSYYTTNSNYTLALARDLVAMGKVEGGTSRRWNLLAQALGVPYPVPLGSGAGTNGGALQNTVGEAVSSGDLLVFSSWSEGYRGACCSTIVTTKQAVQRADARGCPRPALRTEPGPPVPLDVDRGRIVAAGDNQLLVLDAAGTERLAVGVRALAAALSGGDLVVLVRGELRHYDAVDARLLNAWPLPDVPSGRECNTPATFRV